MLKIPFKGSITLFMKNSFPPHKKKSTSMHYIAKCITKTPCKYNGSDLHNFTPKLISPPFNIYVPQSGGII